VLVKYNYSMHHLSEWQIAQIKNLLLEMMQKILGSAQEQIKDPSNIAFEVCINCKELEEEGEHE